MGKVSLADKMRIQTLHEQRLGEKAIMAAYPDKGWALSTVKKICQRVDQMGSATDYKAGCGSFIHLFVQMYETIYKQLEASK